MIEREGDLSGLPGIGKDLAGKIREIVHTGTLKQLEELEEKTPKELGDIMKIQGLGPKKVNAFHKELKITRRKTSARRPRRGKSGNWKDSASKPSR
jgi:DNA polymerase (family X)